MGLLIVGSVSTLHLVGATVYASYRLAWALLGPCSPLIRMAATITIGAWLATTGFHLLFTLSLFRLPVAAAAAFGLAFAASFVPGNRSIRSLFGEDWEHLRKDWGDTLTAGERLSIYVAVPTACLVLVRGLVLPPLGWDWLTYHGLRSAHFVQESSWTFGPAPGPWSKYRHFLAGAEVLDAWAMLPFHSDLLVNVCTWVQWLALGISAAALSEALGLGLRKAVIAGIAVLFVPTALALALSGYVENALSTSLVLAIAFAILFARTARPSYALLTFAASGLAIGIKLHGGLPAGVAGLTVLMGVLFSQRHRRNALLVLPAGLLAVLLPPLPWLWIAYRDTGYPLSPMPVTVFGMRLGISNRELELDLARDLSAAYTLRGELGVLSQVFSYRTDRYALGPLSLLPLLLVPIACLRLLRRGEWCRLLIATAAMAAVLVSYYHPGMAVIRLYWAGNTSRFLITLLALAIPFSFLAFSEGGRLISVYTWLIGGSIFFHAAWIALSGSANFEGVALVQTATLLLLGSATVTIRAATAAASGPALGGRRRFRSLLCNHSGRRLHPEISTAGRMGAVGGAPFHASLLACRSHRSRSARGTPGSRHQWRKPTLRSLVHLSASGPAVAK